MVGVVTIATADRFYLAIVGTFVVTFVDDVIAAAINLINAATANNSVVFVIARNVVNTRSADDVFRTQDVK